MTHLWATVASKSEHDVWSTIKLEVCKGYSTALEHTYNKQRSLQKKLERGLFKNWKAIYTNFRGTFSALKKRLNLHEFKENLAEMATRYMNYRGTKTKVETFYEEHFSHVSLFVCHSTAYLYGARSQFRSF